MKWCRAGSNPSRLSRFPAYVNKSRLLTSHSGMTSSSMRTKAEPINPAPPVTRNLRIFFYISLTDEYQAHIKRNLDYQTIASVANSDRIYKIFQTFSYHSIALKAGPRSIFLLTW